MCRAQQTSLTVGNQMSIVLNAVGNSYIATEDCMPWINRSNDPQCQVCIAGQLEFHRLPMLVLSPKNILILLRRKINVVSLNMESSLTSRTAYLWIPPSSLGKRLGSS
jgi:hypothetical protein